MAVVRLSGSFSLPTIQHFFSAGRLLKPRRATFGVIEHPDLGDGPFDDVVVTYFPAPKSNTGEDVVEISLHGGAYLQQSLLQALANQEGVRLAGPGEFTLRAFINGKMDLSRAEGVAEAIHAQDAAAHNQAQRHLHGGLRSYVEKIRQDVLYVVSFIEAELDFSDHEITQSPLSKHLKPILAVKNRAAALLKTYYYGQRLIEGFRVPLIGPPNTGKSSIFNILHGFDRAIVTEIPGTTRDTIEARLSIAGHTVVLIDTAGVSESQDRIERLGVDRTRQELERADIVLSVQSPGVPPEKIISSENIAVIQVFNKSDLAVPSDTAKDSIDLEISCKTGSGVEALRQKLAEAVLGRRMETKEGLIITSQRQVDTLNRFVGICNNAVKAIEGNAGPEYLASDLHDALNVLGEITGETTPDDILSEIFGRFCIGK